MFHHPVRERERKEESELSKSKGYPKSERKKRERKILSRGITRMKLEHTDTGEIGLAHWH